MRAARSQQPAADRHDTTLRINAPDDGFEREAERAADALVSGQGMGAVAFRMDHVSTLQRCGCGKKNAGGECGSCRRKRLQRQATGTPGTDTLAGTSAPGVVSDVIGSSGVALDHSTRQRMETHFGADFSGVRVHADRRAAQSAAAVNAEAWTVGNHIAFADGAFDPRSTEGQHLLAHELSHVVQQGDGLRRRAGGPRGINPQPDEYEEAQMWEGLKAEYRRAIATGELDDRSLDDWALVSSLNGLKASQIDPLVTKIKKRASDNPTLKVDRIVDYLQTRKSISTPLEKGATVSRDPLDATSVESFSLSIGNTNIKVVSDTSGASGNQTGPTTNLDGTSWATGRDGKVTGVTTTVGGTRIPITPTSFDVTIATKYAERPEVTSGYGRGTTNMDQQLGATTLRVHEGSHGSDYIAWLRANPFPVDLSKGVVGVLTSADARAITAYVRRFQKEAGEDTCDQTDQVGTTQAEFLKTDAGKASGIPLCKGRRRR